MISILKKSAKSLNLLQLKEQLPD
uniref:Serum response factor binding protein 1 n=1 Tax=Pipistrellus kuhlii TaxID=59472 RepID=A0A7J7YYL3_PIPKU|nr:serum response factor binding protein 1 [Pipistrellus kuhlii]